ncbi:MAG: hypothetical protein KGH65_05165 [Candidatus Micrarchaeota archaeon]|nr:hypothetical protein [Candidatus Micrarchaeota archaeon]
MEKKVAHVYQITFDLGNGRQFSANGNFIEGSTEDEMYAEANKVLNVADRIRSRCEIDLLKGELDTRHKYLARAKEDLRRIQAKGKRTPADENQITSITASIEKIIEDVAEGERNLEIAVAKANGKNVMAESHSVN